jgi:iron(III) transport system substrate-binding protein
MGSTRRRFVITGATAVAGAALGIVPRPASSTAVFDDALAKRAKSEGAVSVYTSLDSQIVDAIVAPFTRRFEVKVDYYRGTPAEVMARALQEAMAGGVRADVVDVSDVPGLLEMKKRGLLAAYESPFAAHVLAEAKDPDHMWTGCRLTHAIFQWNTQSLAKPPRRWRDLADAQWQGKLATWSDPGGSEVSRLWTVAEALGWETLRGIAKNQPLIAPTVQTLSQLIEQQERAVAFDQNDNIAARSKLHGRPTDFLFPTDCVPTEIGAVAVVKGCAHPSAARLFLDWWLSDEGQRLLVAGGKVSSRTDLEPPKGYPSLSAIRARVVEAKRFEERRTQIIDRVRDIFSRG